MRYNEQLNLKLYKYANGSFQAQAIIDDYQEVSFEHNIYEAGTFTITINYNIPNALKFERGMFVQFGNNPYDFGEIYSIQDAIGQDGKGSQIRTITGRDARYILKRRVIKNMNSNGLWAMTDKGEIVLRNLIKDQCGPSAESKRQLPIANTIPASADAKGKVYSVSENFTNLYEVCKTIATQSEIGWRMAFDGALTLEVFEGADLSETVRFDTNFESLANGEFTDSSDAYSNAIYIGGKGQNDDRDIYEGEDGTPEGLDRFESWDNQSSLTVESEYEAEALSMLTQYGQTLTMNGNGLAKCPYVFREQYDIGDTVTVAFSGKSAKAQILSITEHWTWGAYDIEFAFGKPQNNLSDQLQLMLRKIQEASNKTNSTDSVRWYTIPTDTAMPKADVTYNTIGFVGTVESGATFKLYLDNQKTGAKTYHVYFKQLGGTGNLTLTTGKAGASNLVLNAGTYVAIIYVDENGNITNTASTPTAMIEAGSTQPATSGAVYDAIQQVQPPTVDTAMSDTSTNAVQNKVIKEYVDTAETNAKNLANATGTLAVAHGGTGQTSLDDVTVGTSKNTSALDKAIDCNTAGATHAKTVTLEGFTLVKGAKLIVNVKNANSGAGALTLNVNSTGAKTIRVNGTVASTSTTTYTMSAGYYNCYYDGTYWNMDSSYEARSARVASTADVGYKTRSMATFTCSTGASTVAKAVSVSGYTLSTRDEVLIYFSNTNTASNPTLNVNSTGAKPIKVFGTSPNSTNGLLKAGTYYCQYDGTNWNCYPYGVTNTVSADNMQSVSSDAVYKKFDWKHIGSTTGTSAISINFDNYDEVLVIANPFNYLGSNLYITSQILPAKYLQAYSGTYSMGYGGTLNSSTPYGFRATIKVTSNSIALEQARYDNSEMASNTFFTVYAR